MELHVEFIREIMKIRKKTIPQLAQDCKMSERTLKNLLYGESEDPRISTLYAVASYLGASIDRLVGLAPPRDFHEEERAYDATLMEGMQDRVKLQEEQLAEKNARIEELTQRIHALEITTGSQEARLESKSNSIQHMDAIIKDQAATIKSQQRTVVICIATVFLLAIAVSYGIWEIINIDRGVSSLLHSDLFQ